MEEIIELVKKAAVKYKDVFAGIEIFQDGRGKISTCLIGKDITAR